jgi:hypothetical protein
MKLPMEFQKSLVSSEFDQGALIQGRADKTLSHLQEAKRFMESEAFTRLPGSQQQTTVQLYRRNVEILQGARAHRGGVCQCLAIKWLKLKMKEQSKKQTGTNKVAPDDRVNLLREADRLDKAIERMTAASNVKFGQIYTVAFEEAMKLYKVTAKKGWDRPVTMKELCSTVKANPHGYFLAGIRCPKLENGKHAIGIYTSDGGMLGAGKHAYVFDPNFGEMKFPLGDFGTLFPKLVLECYGTTNDDVPVFAQFERA